MRSLEIIRLRLSAGNPEALVEEVGAIVEDGSAAVNVRVYRHARVETDVLVSIHRESREGWDRVSDLGLHVASDLGRYGLIEHSVWVEQPGGPRAEGGQR